MRAFVHKETLEEHSLLHGLLIRDGHRFTCPICSKEVVCTFSSHCHQNIDTELNNSSSVPLEFDEGTWSNGTSLRDEYVVKKELTPVKQQDEGARTTRKGRRSKHTENETPSTEEQSGANQCDLCRKTFVYPKCLMRHRSSVHGIKTDASESKNSDGANADDISSSLAGSQEFSEADANGCKGEPVDALNDVSMPPDADALGQHQLLSDIVTTPNDLGLDKNLAVRETCESETPARVVQTRSSKDAKSDAKFTCKTCTKTFKYKTTLVRHWRVVHGGLKCNKCTCPICSQIFDSQVTFSRHFDSAHKKRAAELLSKLKKGYTESNDQVVRCDMCQQWFTCRRSYLKHCGLKHRIVKSSSTGPLRYKCIHCGETFENNRQLVYHRHNKHYVNKSKDDDRETTADEREPAAAAERRMKGEASGDVPSSDDTVDNTSDVDESSESVSGRKKLEPKYFCTDCSKAFVSVAFLVRHRKLKHNSKNAVSFERSASSGKPKKQVFVCGVCSEEFGLEEALSEHMEFIHRGAITETGECACPVCGSQFADQSAFSVHYDSAHHVRTDYHTLSSDEDERGVPRCKPCGHWFTDRRALIAHQCPKKPPVRLKPAGRARYRCSQCGEAFEVLRRFLHHRKVKHRVEGPIAAANNKQATPDTANGDPEVAASESALETIKDPATYCARGRPPKLIDAGDSAAVAKVDQPVTGSGDGGSPNGGGGGGARARLPRGLGRNAPSDGTNLKCPECSRAFPSVSLLRKHRKAEHRNRTCQLCGETCKSADMVYYHNLKYHHEQKCDVCGASCPGRLGLIEHFRSEHPNEPPPLINRKTLICEYCPRVFAGCASRLLRDHIESCHLGRVHLCDVCGKRLGSAQTLAVHRRMHDPVARFACHECNRRFPHNTNLINHIRKHHPERLPAKYVREFRCEVCSMQFGSSSGLTRHRAEKHSSSRHQCDQCLRVFQSVTGLRVHKRREHAQKDNSAPQTAAGTATVAAAAAAAAAASSVVMQPESQPGSVVMVPVAFSDPTMMAGIIAGLPGINHGFQDLR